MSAADAPSGECPYAANNTNGVKPGLLERSPSTLMDTIKEFVFYSH